MYGFNLNTTMDNLRRQSYSESLKTTLNCYQLSSVDSLSGPSGYPALAAQLWFKNEQSPPIPQPPHIQIPLLMPNDTSTQRSETLLGGERISCFIVGGEKRLCLPQILTTVLRDFSISEINKSCAELHIYCSRCSPDQLEILKVLGILPFNTTQCGLITKTDAERLVSSLDVEYHLNAKHNAPNPDVKGIQVYHECFGRGDGIFYPHLYVSKDATCIACLDCRVTLSPKRFVSHSHRGLEKHTCHWGFDPDNWRNYILLPKDTEKPKQKELENQLDALKAKFDSSISSKLSDSSPVLKRRRDSSHGSEHCKRLKEEKPDDGAYCTAPPPAPVCYGIPFPLRHSAFKPWSSGLSVGLPQIPEITASHDDVLFKAFAPIVQDRRLMPGFLHLTPSASMAPQNAAEWTAALRKAQTAPNVCLSPANRHKRIPPLIEGNSRVNSSEVNPRLKRREVSTRKDSDAESPPRRTASGASTSILCCPDMDSNLARSAPRNVSVPEYKSSRSNRIRSPESPQTSAADLSKPAKESDVTGRLDEQKDAPSRYKHAGSPSHSKAVVAASAMLELSSSVQSVSHDVTSASQSSPLMLVKRSSSPPSCFPLITPLDTSHQKWDFRDRHYIISSKGSQELKAIMGILDEVTDACVKEKLLRGIVEMKSRCEEKLDIQTRVQRDLESELDRVKASKDFCLKEADRKRREVRHEMELLRNEHNGRMRDAHASLIDIGRQLSNNQNTTSDQQHRNVLQHKILERLQKEIDDREDVVHRLQKELFIERERREDVEQRVEEQNGRTHGRISLLVDDTISSMIRHSRTPQHSKG